MRRTALPALVLTSFAFASFAAPVQASPVVVELFTSEGCSSCPPADAFLTDLAEHRKDVLPLAFHVTYWNNLGWTDPFSFDAATERQRSYARNLGDGQVYTPEMVVNGELGFVGSDRAQGAAAISRAARDQRSDVRLELARDGDRFTISAGAGQGEATILLIGFDPQHRTPIGRGENGGRTLLESNIVRSLTPVGQWTGAPVRLEAKLPAGENFAVLLQAEDGKILGAATSEMSAL